MSSSIIINSFIEFPSGGGGWLPSDLPDITHWWKATSLALSDNDPVGTWVDDIGTADLTGAGGVRPTYKANGGDPYVEFDGTDDSLSGTIGGLTNFSVTIIWERVSTTNYGRTFETNGDEIYFFQLATGDTQSVYYTLGTGLNRATPAPPSGFLASYMDRVGTDGKYRMDGSETTGTVTIGSGTATTLRVGSNLAGGENANVRIKELIICSDEVAGGDFTDLAAYVNAEYGLTL